MKWIFPVVLLFTLNAHAKSHLQHYGYFGDGARHILGGNYMPEIRDHSTFTFIFDDEEAVGDIRRLEEAQAAGLKAILDVQGIFWAIDENGDWSIRTDYRQRWEKYSSKIRPYLGNILAFYMADEPDHQPFRGVKPTPWNIMVEKLEFTAQVVRQTFPGAKVMFNYSWVGLHFNLPAPPSFDYVGFFCYGPWDSCMMAGFPIPEGLRRVRDELTHPAQKLFIIPEGTSFHYDAHGLSLDQNAIAERADKYLELALSEPRVELLMTFLWQEGTPGSVRNMPPVRERYVSIGKRIKYGDLPDDPQPTPVPTPTPSPKPTPKQGGLFGKVCADQSHWLNALFKGLRWCR
ncbi:MAG: hypothetical protein ABL958_12605 [Bdellovibrionia bacterium]